MRPSEPERPTPFAALSRSRCRSPSMGGHTSGAPCGGGPADAAPIPDPIPIRDGNALTACVLSDCVSRGSRPWATVAEPDRVEGGAMRKLIAAVGTVLGPVHGSPSRVVAPTRLPTTSSTRRSCPFDALAGLPSQRWWGIHGGAGYRIEVPEDWNGELVLWAHGFAGVGLELTVQNHPLRAHLLSRRIRLGRVELPEKRLRREGGCRRHPCAHDPVQRRRGPADVDVHHRGIDGWAHHRGGDRAVPQCVSTALCRSAACSATTNCSTTSSISTWPPSSSAPDHRRFPSIRRHTSARPCRRSNRRSPPARGRRRLPRPASS